MKVRVLRTAADTEQLGAALAINAPRPTGKPLIVYLQGELGSGKTTLARGLLHQLGVAETVRSPTYTLLECYDLPRSRVVHVDLYRLSDASELESLGLPDELQGATLLLIEWPERAVSSLPPPDLQIFMNLATAGRTAHLSTGSQKGVDWIAALDEKSKE